MLVAYIACRCAMYVTRPKSDDYTCRTVRKRLMDAGSNPASSTIYESKGVCWNQVEAFTIKNTTLPVA